jgi:hypothetical protein
VRLAAGCVCIHACIHVLLACAFMSNCGCYLYVVPSTTGVFENSAHQVTGSGATDVPPGRFLFPPGRFIILNAYNVPYFQPLLKWVPVNS